MSDNSTDMRRSTSRPGSWEVDVSGQENEMTDSLLVNRRMDRSEWLALLLLSVLWGGSFFFAGVQVKALPPFTIVFLRVGLAAIILSALVRAIGKRMPADWSTWRAF